MRRADTYWMRPVSFGFLALAACLLASPGAEAAQRKRPAPCKPDLASCPVTGCAKAGTADALTNRLKRTVPTGTTATLLTLDDFQQLQDKTDDLVGQNTALSSTARAKLRGLRVSDNRTVSEGDLVAVSGFIVGKPHANTGESVNCRLRRQENNDFHITVAHDREDSEFEGIVVEMIPQDRPAGWTVPKLREVARAGQRVLFHGQLFYDNKHWVNDNAAEPLSGQPARFSLWEVHPITKFFVCAREDNACDPQDVSQGWSVVE